MLSKLRDYSSYFLWFVVVTFVGFMAFSGVQECGTGPAQRGIMAEVNGQPITYVAFSQAMARSTQNRQQSGEELTDEQIAELREQTWNQLIGAILLEQETTKRGIQVTDEELAMFLRQYPPEDLQQSPAFQTEGQFDYQKYLAAMSNTSPEFTNFWRSVEGFWRPQLRQSKLQQQIISTVRVSEAELIDYFHANNDAVRAEFLTIRANDYSSEVESPTDEQLLELYDDEKSRYQRGERVKLDLAIWNRVPSEADKQWVYQQILDVKAQVDEGGDFTELAELYSMGPTSVDGGDLGWFGKGAMVKPFEDAAYALEIGAVSDPVETRFGWHIIKVEEERTSESDPKEKERRARHILIRPEVSQATLDSIYAAVEEFALAIRDGRAEFTDEAVTAAAGRFFESRAVQRGENIPLIGAAPNVKAWAFGAEPGAISDPIDDGGRFVVAKLVFRRPAGIADFEEVKSLVQGRYTSMKARDLARAQADSLHREAQGGARLSDLATAENVTNTTTGLFTRTTSVASVGRSPLFMGRTFSLTEEAPLSEPVPLESGWAVIHLLEKQVADTAAMGSVRDSLAGEILRGKQNNLFTKWFTDLYDRSDIKDYRGEQYGSTL